MLPGHSFYAFLLCEWSIVGHSGPVLPVSHTHHSKLKSQCWASLFEQSNEHVSGFSKKHSRSTDDGGSSPDRGNSLEPVIETVLGLV